MSSRKTLSIVLAIVLVDMVGVGILIPIIPLLFTDPSYAYHLHLDEDTGYLLLGALTALYPFAQFIAMPILGQLSDTFGRRPLLIFSLLGSAISYGLFALGIILLNLPLLFLSRALDGLTGGSISVAQAVAADTTLAEERVRSFAYISAANGVGYILGPLLGALLSDSSIFHLFTAPVPFWFAMGFSFLNMFAVLFFLPETHKKKTRHRIRVWQAFRDIKEAATKRSHRALYITTFLYQSGFAFIITFFGVYLISRFNFGQGYIGYIFAFVGLLLAFTQIAIASPLSRYAKPQAVISVALLAMSASLIGVYFVHDVFFLYLLTIPTAITAGLVVTNLTAFVSTSSRDREQGSALGINSSVQALAQTIPPIFAGVIAAVLAPTTPVLFAAGFIGLAGIFFIVTQRRVLMGQA